MKIILPSSMEFASFSLGGERYELSTGDDGSTILRVNRGNNEIEIIGLNNDEGDVIVTISNEMGEARFDLLGGRFSHVPEPVAHVLITAMAAVEAQKTYVEAVRDRAEMWKATHHTLMPHRQPTATQRVVGFLENPNVYPRGIRGVLNRAFA